MSSQCDGVSEPGFRRRRRGRVSLDSVGSEQDSSPTSLSPDSTGSACNLEKDVSIFLQRIGQKQDGCNDEEPFDFRRRSSARKNYADSLRSSIASRSGRSTSTDDECMYCDTFQNERQYFMWRSQYVRSSYCNRCSEEDVPYISYWGKPSYEHGSWRKRYKAGRNVDIDLSPLHEVLHRIDMMDTSMGKPNKMHSSYSLEKDIYKSNLTRIADPRLHSHSSALDTDQRISSEDGSPLTSEEVRTCEYNASENVFIGSEINVKSPEKPTIASVGNEIIEDDIGQYKTERKLVNKPCNDIDRTVKVTEKATDKSHIMNTDELNTDGRENYVDSFSDPCSSQNTDTNSSQSDISYSSINDDESGSQKANITNKAQVVGKLVNEHDYDYNNFSAVQNRKVNKQKSKKDTNLETSVKHNAETNKGASSRIDNSELNPNTMSCHSHGIVKKETHQEQTDQSKSVKDIITNMEAIAARQKKVAPPKLQTNTVKKLSPNRFNSQGAFSEPDKTETSNKINNSDGLLNSNVTSQKTTIKEPMLVGNNANVHTDTVTAVSKHANDEELCKGSESANAFYAEENNDCECEPELIARSNSMTKEEFINFIRSHPAAKSRRSVIKITSTPNLDNITENTEHLQSPMIQITHASNLKHSPDAAFNKTVQIRDDANVIPKSDVRCNVVESLKSEISFPIKSKHESDNNDMASTPNKQHRSKRRSSKSDKNSKTVFTTNGDHAIETKQDFKCTTESSNNDLKASTHTKTLIIPESHISAIQISKTPEESDQRSNKSNGSFSSYSGSRYQPRRRLSRSERSRRSSLHNASLDIGDEDDEFMQIQQKLSSLGRYSKWRAPAKSEDKEDTIAIPKNIWNRSIRNQIYGVPLQYSSCEESAKDSDSEDEDDSSAVHLASPKCITPTPLTTAKMSTQVSDTNNSLNVSSTSSISTEEGNIQYQKRRTNTTYASKEHTIKHNSSVNKRQLGKCNSAFENADTFRSKQHIGIDGSRTSSTRRGSFKTDDTNESKISATTTRRELSVSPRTVRLRHSSPRSKQSTDTEGYTDDGASGSAIELDSDDEEAQKLRCRSRGYSYDFFMSRQSRTGTEIIEQYKQSRSNKSSKGTSPASSSESSRKSSFTSRQRPKIAVRTLGSLGENDLLKVVQQPTRTRRARRRNSDVSNELGNAAKAAGTGVNANLLKVALERAAQCSERLEDRLKEQLK